MRRALAGGYDGFDLQGDLLAYLLRTGGSVE
jgi:hypothetical protein